MKNLQTLMTLTFVMALSASCHAMENQPPQQEELTQAELDHQQELTAAEQAEQAEQINNIIDEPFFLNNDFLFNVNDNDMNPAAHGNLEPLFF